MDILDNILHLLKVNKKRQKELTDYLSLSHNVFTEWKAGRNTSYKRRLPEIAEFFGVSVDYLAGTETPDANNGFTYAFYNELTHGLSPEQIEQLKNFAEFLRNS